MTEHDFINDNNRFSPGTPEDSFQQYIPYMATRGATSMPFGLTPNSMAGMYQAQGITNNFSPIRPLEQNFARTPGYTFDRGETILQTGQKMSVFGTNTAELNLAYSQSKSEFFAENGGLTASMIGSAIGGTVGGGIVGGIAGSIVGGVAAETIGSPLFNKALADSATTGRIQNISSMMGNFDPDNFDGGFAFKRSKAGRLRKEIGDMAAADSRFSESDIVDAMAAMAKSGKAGAVDPNSLKKVSEDLKKLAGILGTGDIDEIVSSIQKINSSGVSGAAAIQRISRTQSAAQMAGVSYNDMNNFRAQLEDSQRRESLETNLVSSSNSANAMLFGATSKFTEGVADRYKNNTTEASKLYSSFTTGMNNFSDNVGRYGYGTISSSGLSAIVAAKTAVENKELSGDELAELQAKNIKQAVKDTSVMSVKERNGYVSREAKKLIDSRIDLGNDKRSIELLARGDTESLVRGRQELSDRYSKGMSNGITDKEALQMQVSNIESIKKSAGPSTDIIMESYLGTEQKAMFDNFSNVSSGLRGQLIKEDAKLQMQNRRVFKDSITTQALANRQSKEASENMPFKDFFNEFIDGNIAKTTEAYRNEVITKRLENKNAFSKHNGGSDALLFEMLDTDKNKISEKNNKHNNALERFNKFNKIDKVTSDIFGGSFLPGMVQPSLVGMTISMKKLSSLQDDMADDITGARELKLKRERFEGDNSLISKFSNSISNSISGFYNSLSPVQYVKSMNFFEKGAMQDRISDAQDFQKIKKDVYLRQKEMNTADEGYSAVTTGFSDTARKTLRKNIKSVSSILNSDRSNDEKTEAIEQVMESQGGIVTKGGKQTIRSLVESNNINKSENKSNVASQIVSSISEEGSALNKFVLTDQKKLMPKILGAVKDSDSGTDLIKRMSGIMRDNGASQSDIFAVKKQLHDSMTSETSEESLRNFSNIGIGSDKILSDSLKHEDGRNKLKDFLSGSSSLTDAEFRKGLSERFGMSEDTINYVSKRRLELSGKYSKEMTENLLAGTIEGYTNANSSGSRELTMAKNNTDAYGVYNSVGFIKDVFHTTKLDMAKEIDSLQEGMTTSEKDQSSKMMTDADNKNLSDEDMSKSFSKVFGKETADKMVDIVKSGKKVKMSDTGYVGYSTAKAKRDSVMESDFIAHESAYDYYNRTGKDYGKKLDDITDGMSSEEKQKFSSILTKAGAKGLSEEDVNKKFISEGFGKDVANDASELYAKIYKNGDREHMVATGMLGETDATTNKAIKEAKNEIELRGGKREKNNEIIANISDKYDLNDDQKTNLENYMFMTNNGKEEYGEGMLGGKTSSELFGKGGMFEGVATKYKESPEKLLRDREKFSAEANAIGINLNEMMMSGMSTDDMIDTAKDKHASMGLLKHIKMIGDARDKSDKKLNYDQIVSSIASAASEEKINATYAESFAKVGKGLVSYNKNGDAYIKKDKMKILKNIRADIRKDMEGGATYEEALEKEGKKLENGSQKQRDVFAAMTGQEGSSTEQITSILGTIAGEAGNIKETNNILRNIESKIGANPHQVSTN